MPTVLVLLAEGFEEIEYTTPVDLMRRAGFEVTSAALAESVHVTGRSGITLHADTLLSNVSEKSFDLIVLPGGPGVKNLRADPRVAPLIRAQATAGKWVAAICAAPVLLQDASLLERRRYTAHFSVAGELTHILQEERVVIDGRIITSRGAGTALDFGLAVISALASPEKAAQVAAAICF